MLLNINFKLTYRVLCTKWLKELKTSDSIVKDLNKHAEEWRLQGNVFIKTGKEYSSLAAVCYSIAICLSNEMANLALSYANRSVALMGMGFYKEALIDCFVAIEHKYPQDKIDKVYLRIATCSIETKQPPSVFGKVLADLDEWSTARNNKDKFIDICKQIN